MAKLTCIKQNIFGNTGPTGVLTAFGSFKSGTGAVFTNNLESIATADWDYGLFSARNPTKRSLIIEDLNSILFSITRQMYYLQSDFFPELSALSTYQQGSFASKKETDTNDSVIYTTTENDTLNKAFTTDYWRPVFYSHYLSVTGNSGVTHSIGKDDYILDTSFPHYCTGNNAWVLPTIDKSIWGKKYVLTLETYLTSTQTIYPANGSGDLINNSASISYEIDSYETYTLIITCVKNGDWFCQSRSGVNYKTLFVFDDPEQTIANEYGLSSYSAYSKFRLYDSKVGY